MRYKTKWFHVRICNQRQKEVVSEEFLRTEETLSFLKERGLIRSAKWLYQLPEKGKSIILGDKGKMLAKDYASDNYIKAWIIPEDNPLSSFSSYRVINNIYFLQISDGGYVDDRQSPVWEDIHTFYRKRCFNRYARDTKLPLYREAFERFSASLDRVALARGVAIGVHLALQDCLGRSIPQITLEELRLYTEAYITHIGFDPKICIEQGYRMIEFLSEILQDKNFHQTVVKRTTIV